MMQKRDRIKPHGSAPKPTTSAALVSLFARANSPHCSSSGSVYNGIRSRPFSPLSHRRRRRRPEIEGPAIQLHNSSLHTTRDANSALAHRCSLSTQISRARAFSRRAAQRARGAEARPAQLAERRRGEPTRARLLSVCLITLFVRFCENYCDEYSIVATLGTVEQLYVG